LHYRAGSFGSSPASSAPRSMVLNPWKGRETNFGFFGQIFSGLLAGL